MAPNELLDHTQTNQIEYTHIALNIFQDKLKKKKLNVNKIMT